MQGYIGFDTFNHQFIKRMQGFRYRLLTCLTVTDQLANQGIIIAWNLITWVEVRVKTHARATWGKQLIDRTWARHKGRWIFGIDTTLYGVALNFNLALTIR